MPKKIQIILFFAFFLVLFFGISGNAKAESCDIDINFVLRDPDGNFIPGASVDIYRQVLDANGYHKPGTRLAGAKVNATLGSALIHYRDTEGGGTIVAQVKTNNNANSHFYFYDLSATCGDNSFDEVLSGLNVVLRDAEGSLQKDAKINVYTQKYDADNKPVRERKDLIATLNTSVIGEAKIYVPQGSVNSVDGRGSDYYVIEIVRPKGTFFKYDLGVVAGAMTNIEYFLSALRASFTSPDGSFFPGKTKVEVFKQTTDANNQRQKGGKVGEFYTDDSGTGTFEYPEGLYVAGLIGKDGKYQYFWDLEIADQKLSEYNLSSDTNWTPNAGACESNSTFTLTVGDYRNQPLTGLKFELYEQSMNLNGQAAPVGQPVVKGVIDSGGRAISTFKPDSRKTYVLKIYDKSPNFGEFWFFNAVKFTCGYDRNLSKNLPGLKIVLRDSLGRLKKNADISIYTQQLDADGNPVRDKKDLVATLNTGAEGQVSLYVASAHPYDLEKPGVYVLTTVGDKNSQFALYNVKASASQDTVVNFNLSEIFITAKNASGQLLANQEVKLYEQTQSSQGRALGKLITQGKTDKNGIWRLEYPSGTYALVIKDDLKQDNVFWDAKVQDGISNRFVINANLTQVSINNSQVINLSSSFNLKVFALTNSGGNSYIKAKELGALAFRTGVNNRFSLASGYYLISYVDSKNKVEYGQALGAQNGKLQKITLSLKASSRITGDQVFTLSPVPLSTATNVTPSSAGSTATSGSSTASNTTLANKLKGYILLQTENQGQAWYVNPKTGKRRYLANGQAAFNLMRSLGLGISDANLRKLPVGLDNRFYGSFEDSDGDELPDVLERPIGTSVLNSDTDGDGFLDGREVANSFDPWRVNQRWPLDVKLLESVKGKILLQVNAAGEAWYVYPKNGKRYFLADGATAFQIMKYLGLGVSNQDLAKIPVEE